MATDRDLVALQEARSHGIGRLLLLARRDFLRRLALRLHQDVDAVILSRSHLLPYIDVGGTRASDLARRLGVSKQAVARLVRELEGEGLLAREADASDGRAFRVVFTRAGLSYLKRMHRAIGAIERDYERQFGAERFALLRETLRVLAYGAPETATKRAMR